MTTRFYPKGYIGSEQGILRVAKKRDPNHWIPERIHPDELPVWEGLGTRYNALLLQNHLSVLVPIEQRKDDTSMIDRLCDFGDALVEIRKALHAGDLVAEFLDESGKFDSISKDGWGGGAGEETLLRGIVDIADRGSRLMLFRIMTLDQFAASLPPAWPEPVLETNLRPAPRMLAKKLPVSEKRRLFREWRDSSAERIPPLSEDVAQMKLAGISREDTRQLRKDFPRLPRGKRRQNPESNRRAK
jgi:hypothetical protein